MRRVFVESFGCRASQADGAAIESSLRDRGHEPVRDRHAADLVVLNTCTVTHSADVDVRRTIRNWHRDHPEVDILVTGCYAQRAPEEIVGLPGVRWVVGNSRKTEIAAVIGEDTEEYHGQIISGEFTRDSVFLATPVRDTRDDRTRPNLKIQDGCSNRCTFCIIPSVRGRSRSAGLTSVVEQCRNLSERYSEVVLSGINLGRWGRDLPGSLRLPDLLQSVLAETPIKRIRLSSVEPMDWSRDLLDLMASESRVAQHVHMPLQSGSDAVLKRMARKYRSGHYASRVLLARDLMPDAAIGADVMTGFPGESDAEFEATLQFIEHHPFTYLHVFTYSERPGTAASQYSNPVPVELRRERTRQLRELSSRKAQNFRNCMLGKTLSAVTLEEPGVALTSNFLRVRLAYPRQANQLISVTVDRTEGDYLCERALLPVLT
jgi:threonylcarbamoyladenosine tRNA methylthiotransferase MtaB